jgi:hypothetical protein
MGCPDMIVCTNLTESKTTTVMPDVVDIGVSNESNKLFCRLIPMSHSDLGVFSFNCDIGQ